MERKLATAEGVIFLFSTAYSLGGRGIRTPEGLTTLTVFKTAAFDRSAIPPLPKLTGFAKRRKSRLTDGE